jgi:hypothetical protein
MVNTQNLLTQWQAAQVTPETNAANTMVAMQNSSWDRLALGTYTMTPQDTVNVTEEEHWGDYFTSLLRTEGIDARGGANAKSDSRSGHYVKVYGEKKSTDCRGAGMKRIGLYHHNGTYYLTTWGMTKAEITNNQLEPWVARIKAVCDTDSNWLGIDSDKWPTEWVKRGKNGGCTTRFLIVSGMKKSAVCSAVKKLIN